MKNLKTILSVFAIAAVFSSTAFAQTDVNVAAKVEANISVTKNDNVDFAGIQATSNPVLDPNGTNTDVGAGAKVGKLTISASNSTQLVINWDQTSVTLGDGTNTMTFTPDITAYQTDTPASSVALTKATANAASATSGSGALFVYIGGNLGALSGQTAGTYSSSAANGSGDLTFTVNYQ